jgi:integrase/recombinase XerD
MKIVKIDKTVHSGKEVVVLQFPYDTILGEEVRKIKGMLWSKNLKSWYAPYSIAILNEIKKTFDKISIIDAKPLREKIANEKLILSDKKTLCIETLHQIEKFIKWMHSRRYSENTVTTYSDALKTFLIYYHNKSIIEITNEDVIGFNNEYIIAKKYSASYQNQVVNAIKLFFRTMQNIKIDIELIHRPKRERVLPNVLSKEEVKKILGAPKNLKHQAMLSLIYSCGLRCGEVLRLKPEHLLSERNILLIKQSKGKKDRIAPLSDKTISLLRTYFNMFKPKIYLFEGAVEGRPYDERSLQNVLKQSLAKSGIKKPVTLHWLRHSYATHLLENGTDLRYIQEILGHSSSKTTEIYTHVSTKSIQKITSPFDFL